MDVINYSTLRRNLKQVMDRVIDDSEEMAISRSSGDGVVIVSLEYWNSVQETLHLLSTPANAARLRRSIAELDADEGHEHELREP